MILHHSNSYVDTKFTQSDLLALSNKSKKKKLYKIKEQP